MNTYQILIVISLLIIFSYLFDLFAKKTLFPSVLLLLITGAVIKYSSVQLNLPIIDFSVLLPILGNLGLVLIILEGALELDYKKSKIPLIKKAFGAALFPMIITITLITTLFIFYYSIDFHTAILNAIPFAIISSAIAIPSSASLSLNKREFIIYESSISDIIGIILFNFVFVNTTLTFSSILGLGSEILIILGVSAACCLIILFLLAKITLKIKYFLLFAVILLVYAIGKYFHLSSLLVILVVGLFLRNTSFFEINWFKKHFIYPNLKDDVSQLINFTAESAFLMRTFFFFIFGYTLNLHELLNSEIVIIGLTILIIIFVIRFFYLKYASERELIPEALISPRGLISILLFFTIPVEQWISPTENGLILSIIVGTSVVMAIGLLFSKRKPKTFS